MLLTDLSLYPARYNEFDITVGVDIDLAQDGDYKYMAYQMPTDTDTNYEDNGYLVEVGKMRLLKETEVTIKQYEGTNDIKIFS